MGLLIHSFHFRRLFLQHVPIVAANNEAGGDSVDPAAVPTEDEDTAAAEAEWQGGGAEVVKVLEDEVAAARHSLVQEESRREVLQQQMGKLKTKSVEVVKRYKAQMQVVNRLEATAASDAQRFQQLEQELESAAAEAQADATSSAGAGQAQLELEAQRSELEEQLARVEAVAAREAQNLKEEVEKLQANSGTSGTFCLLLWRQQSGGRKCSHLACIWHYA